MKKKLLAAILISASLLVGCGSDEEVSGPIVTVEPQQIGDTGNSSQPEASAPADGGASVVLQPGGEDHPIQERTVVNGKMQSYLTGEWKDADVVQRRSMAVMIPNNAAAMPQYGISYASVVYEAPVEGRITRIMGIFEDYDDLERIGPVRSSRDYYVYQAMAFDSIYCNWGLAVPYVSPIINTDRVDNVSQAVSGIDVASPGAFDRVSRGTSYKTEYTGYLFIDGYEKAVEKLGYDTTYDEHGRFTKAFSFADEGYKATYDDYPAATAIYPGGQSTNSGGYGNAKPYFEFHEDDGLYYRFQSGAPQIDEYNDEQLSYANVIFQVCHGEVRDANDYLAFGLIGSGTAYVFTNGKVVEGTWKHKSDYDPFTYYDKSGDEIVLNQGKTWICCIWDEYEDCAEWK